MGAATAWLIVKGITPELVREILRLTTEPSEKERTARFSIQGCELSSGWYALVFPARWTWPFQSRFLKVLSNEAEVITGYIETRVMCSEASGWRNGQQVWNLSYFSDEEPRDIRLTGDPPKEYLPIYKRLTDEQRREGYDCGIDYLIDIPIELTQALTGFHYDEPAGNEEWTLLGQLKPQPIWKRLFGL